MDLCETNTKEWWLRLNFLDGNRIILEDPHCPLCHRRLWKNSIYQKVGYPDDFENRIEFELQRYNCPDCGEIRIYYSHIFESMTKYTQYSRAGII